MADAVQDNKKKAPAPKKVQPVAEAKPQAPAIQPAAKAAAKPAPKAKAIAQPKPAPTQAPKASMWFAECRAAHVMPVSTTDATAINASSPSESS